MLVHTTTGKHWTIGAVSDGGSHCPECGAGATQRCSYQSPRGLVLLPWTTVHTERVNQAGHATKFDELPVHRAKIPDGALAELKRLRK